MKKSNMRDIHKYITHNIARAHAKSTRTRIKIQSSSVSRSGGNCRRIFCDCGVDDFTKCYDFCLKYNIMFK